MNLPYDLIISPMLYLSDRTTMLECVCVSSDINKRLHKVVCLLIKKRKHIITTNGLITFIYTNSNIVDVLSLPSPAVVFEQTIDLTGTLVASSTTVMSKRSEGKLFVHVISKSNTVRSLTTLFEKRDIQLQEEDRIIIDGNLGYRLEYVYRSSQLVEATQKEQSEWYKMLYYIFVSKKLKHYY